MSDHYQEMVTIFREWMRAVEHLPGKHNQKSHGNKYGSSSAIKSNVKRLGSDKAALKNMATKAKGDVLTQRNRLLGRMNAQSQKRAWAKSSVSPNNPLKSQDAAKRMLKQGGILGLENTGGDAATIIVGKVGDLGKAGKITLLVADKGNTTISHELPKTGKAFNDLISQATNSSKKWQVSFNTMESAQ